jgi:cytochrome c-type protein NapB
MNRKVIIVAALALTLGGAAVAGDAISDLNMGLSKTSVFDTPAPQHADPSGSEPGNARILPRAFLGAPPLIGHEVASSLPILSSENKCIDCHDEQGEWGMEIGKGDPIPMPRSHYTDLRADDGVVHEQVVGARYNCLQCHAPQANVKPLVANTFETRTAEKK